MTYGEALRKLLRERDMNQAELARAIGKSNSYVSQLLSGKVKEPSVSVAFDIADALGVRVQDFLNLIHSKEKDGVVKRDPISSTLPVDDLAPDENRLLLCYRSSNVQGRAAIMAVAESSAGDGVEGAERRAV